MKSLLVLVFTTLSGLCLGQKTISDFALPDVAGQTVSLTGFSSSRAVVVIFTSNDCAFDGYYTGRIKSLAESFEGKIQFLLINSYPGAAESVDRMALLYKTWDLSIPYLADKDQQVMELLGARKSPEAFLLKKVAGKFAIAYQGAIDDNPQFASDVKQHYLRDAIEKLLANQGIVQPLVRTSGCSIRKK